MSNIDDIIKRSRARGGFKQKGYFTLEYQKAKSKVSEFALPEAYYFCLEFIQSAVALGATYIDIRVEDSKSIVSFLGAHYLRDDLERLFDFLLTTSDEAHFRARRRLAIGMAAVLSRPNSHVEIESGDGTLEGSSRLEISDINEQAVIGTPKKAIDGTFIKSSYGGLITLNPGSSNKDDGSYFLSNILAPEQLLIESRCLDVPVPVCVNDDMITGYNPRRVIRLPEYMNAVGINQGDLYGGIAYDTTRQERKGEIKILTNGVWITSRSIDRLPDGISGTVGYERLHKTASQYEIVEDGRLDEFVERLKPFVDEVNRRRGLTDEERLDFLFDRPAPEFEKRGSPLKIKIEGRNNAGGTLTLWINPEKNAGLSLYTKLASKNRLLDAVPIDCQYPLIGEWSLEEIGLADVRFRQPEDPDFAPHLVLGLAPHLYQLFFEKFLDAKTQKKVEFWVGSEIESLNSNSEPQPEEVPRKKEAPPKLDSQAADEQIVALDKEQFIDVPDAVWDAAVEEAGLSPQWMNDTEAPATSQEVLRDVVEMLDEKTPARRRPKKTAPKNPLDSNRELTRRISQPSDDVRAGVAQILEDIFAVDVEQIRTAEERKTGWNGRVVLLDDESKQRLPTFFGSQEQKSSITRLVVNCAHPLMKRSLESLKTKPQSLLVILMAAIDAMESKERWLIHTKAIERNIMLSAIEWMK